MITLAVYSCHASLHFWDTEIIIVPCCNDLRYDQCYFANKSCESHLLHGFYSANSDVFKKNNYKKKTSEYLEFYVIQLSSRLEKLIVLQS